MPVIDRLQLYHRLPYGLKVAAASLHGLRLRRWRYDRETDRRVHEALERDRWSAEQWQEWREPRLKALLERAARLVPVYGRMLGGRVPRDLADWPVLEKADLRAAPRDFVAGDADPRWLYAEHTSGTTGTPLRLWWSKEAVRRWYALVEARSRRWYGVDRGDRWAILGGQLVADPARREPPFWVWNAGLRQLYLSSYHLAPDLLPSYVEAMHRHRVRYVWGYTSALASLAAGLLEHGGAAALGLDLDVVIANAEPVYAHQRLLIERAFGCPLRETYGMAELAAAAGECEVGTLHLWPDVGVTEVLRDDGSPAEPGETGELVATGLINTAQPLVRYRVGDRIRLGETGACRCGRTLPIVEAIEGRSDDVIVTPDGRQIGRLDPLFKGELPIVEAQIVQETADRVRLRYVAENGRDVDQRLRDLVAERLGGSMSVEVERVAKIERDRRGKFRAVIKGMKSQPGS